MDRLPETDRLNTLGEWLRFAEKLYAREKLAFGQVATNAHDEALYLLLRTLGLSLESDAGVLEKKLTIAERVKVSEVLRRRVVERVPAAYLTHEAWLGEHRFYVDERVIIPRSYFLEIIPQLGRHHADSRDPILQCVTSAAVRRIADVCTGSGCLAIVLAHHFPLARVDAIDLSPAALEVAKINVREHRLKARVRLIESDVFDSLPPASTLPRKGLPVKYDLIVCNPPYEPSSVVDAQQPEFKAEPRMAHDGGPDGLGIIRKLLRQAGPRLAPDGIVMVEVGGLREAVEREFAALEPSWLHTMDSSNCVAVFRAARLQ